MGNVQADENDTTPEAPRNECCFYLNYPSREGVEGGPRYFCQIPDTSNPTVVYPSSSCRAQNGVWISLINERIQFFEYIDGYHSLFKRGKSFNINEYPNETKPML